MVGIQTDQPQSDIQLHIRDLPAACTPLHFTGISGLGKWISLKVSLVIFNYYKRSSEVPWPRMQHMP
jgi:hypothetical protein